MEDLGTILGRSISQPLGSQRERYILQSLEQPASSEEPKMKS